MSTPTTTPIHDLSHDGPALPPRRRSLAIVGVGAFGEFCIPHLRRFLDVRVCDAARDLKPLCETWEVDAVDLPTAAQQDVVLLAVPLRSLRAVARAIAPHLRPGTVVVDVCSVKTEPLRILMEELPETVPVVGTHPLFGPHSGRHGIAGLRIAVCGPSSAKRRILTRFLRRHLALDVIGTTADDHDRQMAYIQGLTHLLGRVTAAMALPPLDLTTESFGHLRHMVEMVRHDTDELFRTIVLDNPYGPEAMRAFVDAAREVLRPVSPPSNHIL